MKCNFFVFFSPRVLKYLNEHMPLPQSLSHLRRMTKRPINSLERSAHVDSKEEEKKEKEAVVICVLLGPDFPLPLPDGLLQLQNGGEVFSVKVPRSPPLTTEQYEVCLGLHWCVLSNSFVSFILLNHFHFLSQKQNL